MDLVRLFALCLAGVWVFPVYLSPVSARAADAVTEEPVETEPPVAPNPDARFKLQIGDEEPVPFDPKTPETPQNKSRRTAITWQLAGQMHLSQGDQEKSRMQQAEDCFRKAIAADPTFIRSYQMMVSLLVSGPVDEAKFSEAQSIAFQAAEHSPEGFTLVRQLAGLFARQKVDRGIEVLAAASQLKTLNPQSVTYFLIQRDLGTLYHRGGRISEASECYKIVFDAVTKTDPALFNAEQIKEVMGIPADMYEAMGEVFLASKQPNLALDAFSRASHIRGGRSAAHSYNLAQVFKETGKPAEALDELQKYLDAQLQSRGRGAYQLLKDLLVDLRRESELTDRLEKMRAQDPQNSQLRFFLAEQFVDQKRFEEAEKLILNGQMETRDPFGLVGLIPVYRGLKKYEPLLTLLISAKGLPDPDDENALATLEPELRTLVERFDKERGQVTGDIVTMDGLVKLGKEWQQGDEPKIQFPQAWVLGELCGMASRVDDAVVFYRQAIELRNEPEFPLYYELGQVLLEADRYEDAITMWKECVNHPSSGLQEQRWRSLYMLSFAYEFANKTQDAFAALSEANTAAAQSGMSDFAGPILHAQLGWIHHHSDDLDKAITIYEEVLQKYPKNQNTQKTLQHVRFSLSAVLVLKGEMEKGEGVLQEVLKDDPENTQANNDLGYLWAEQGKNLDQALVMINKALAKDPDHAAYLDSLGWVLFKLGQTEEAVKKLEQACGMKRGDDPTLYEHLGDCYAKLGRVDDAKKTWTKALELMDQKKSKDVKLRKSLRDKLGLPQE